MTADSKPIISVIIPHFERADLLQKAIASVLASSEKRFEIVVVDDGSSEEQWNKVKALAGPAVSVLQRIDGLKGPSRCRNLGLSVCRGDYVLFLDSDDLIAPWCLKQRLELAVSNPEIELLIFPVLLFANYPGDSDLQWNALETSIPDLDRFLQSDPVWQTSSPLWRRETLTALGGFNEAVFYGDDADLHIRALLSGVKLEKFGNCLPDVFIRRSDAARITNSLSRSLVESRRIRLREGTLFLKHRQNRREYLHLWEGQYFVEAEFLLFNLEGSREAIQRVLRDWNLEFRPNLIKRLMVSIYFSVALVSRKKLYILLRLVRWLMIASLPSHFFPRGGSFQNAKTAPAVFTQVRRQLSLRP